MIETPRILLGNLHDFDNKKDAIPYAKMSLIDQWILERLHQVNLECAKGYETFQFRKAYNAINNFCTNDLSSIYIDITKDRMYCDLPDAHKRRSTQTCMSKVFNDLCHLLAPILCYTADEAWEHAGHSPGDIHCALFPKPDPEHVPGNAIQKVDQLLTYRNLIQQSIEPLRQEKVIRSNYQASVQLSLAEGSATPEELLGSAEDVNEFFMLSSLSIITDQGGPTATTAKSTHPKCPRCWRLLETQHEYYLCARCEKAIS